jgi:hypothetical protein
MNALRIHAPACRLFGLYPLLLLGLCFALGPARADAQERPVPPEPPTGDLAAIGRWIEHWLPVVGAFSYPAIEGTGDFLAHASDSVMAAALEACTLVLRERSVTTVHAEPVESRRDIRVPLALVDTSGIEPRIRRPGMLLGRPHVMVTGQLVIPLRTPTRTPFITVLTGHPEGDSLAVEHLIPVQFAVIPANRSARAIRRAAALCHPGPEPKHDGPLEPETVLGY